MSDLSSNILPNFVVQCYHCYSFFSFNQISAIPFGVSCHDFSIILTCFRWAVQGSPFPRTDQMGLLCPPLQQYVNFVLQFTNKGFIWLTFSLFFFDTLDLFWINCRQCLILRAKLLLSRILCPSMKVASWYDFLLTLFFFPPSTGPSPSSQTING